jgi:hypothetical protein
MANPFPGDDPNANTENLFPWIVISAIFISMLLLIAVASN